MKTIVLLLIFLFALLGCAERYDADSGDTVRIVSTDPPRRLIDPEILMHYSVPPYVIKMKREEYQTIIVTFSSPLKSFL